MKTKKITPQDLAEKIRQLLKGLRDSGYSMSSLEKLKQEGRKIVIIDKKRYSIDGCICLISIPAEQELILNTIATLSRTICEGYKMAIDMNKVLKRLKELQSNHVKAN